LQKSEIWKYVSGAMVALECLGNEWSGSWHPHLNVALAGPYLDEPALIAAWVKATRGRGQILRIREMDAQGPYEVFKYVADFKGLLDAPTEAFKEFVDFIQRCRRVRSYGIFYGCMTLKEKVQMDFCPCSKQAPLQSLVTLSLDEIAFDSAGSLLPVPFASELIGVPRAPPGLFHFLPGVEVRHPEIADQLVHNAGVVSQVRRPGADPRPPGVAA